MTELRCSLCGYRTGLCTCDRLLPPHHRPDGNIDRERALDKLGKQLDRMEPVTTPFDFASLVPDQDECMASDAELERARIVAEREDRLCDSGIAKAITEDDFQRVVHAWREESKRIFPVIGAEGFPHYTQALRNVVGWENKRSTGTYAFAVLVLLGLKGIGKTVAGAWLLAGHGPGLYTTAEQLRASFDSKLERERELYYRALKARVLFVDELGREKDAVTADAMLFDVVNNRRGRAGRSGQLWTLLAGNLSDEDFRKRYDGSTVDRIEQLGVIVKVEGDNLRGRLIDELREQKKRERGGV
jgi:hypothetical protein